MQKNNIKQIAIIGATASGKSQLAIDIAKEFNSIILSLDSLSVYKEIDIVSAKPTIEERDGIPHYGVDIIYPDKAFDVAIFIDLYREIYQKAVDECKNLIIVGGSGFYLKSLIDGISPLPNLSSENVEEITYRMQDIERVHRELYLLDKSYMLNISTRDRYRTQRALGIYLASGMTPSEYFKEHRAVSVVNGQLPIYSILTDRDILRKRIELRTIKMLEMGLIDEVAYLERRYNRSPNAMKSIGIRETLDYFDGRLNMKRLKEKITTNTARLAKRQSSFNRSQFKDVTALELNLLKSKIIDDLMSYE